MKTWNGVTATSDAANNLKTDPSNSEIYNWDARNQLTEVAPYSSGSMKFTYDAMGRRNGKIFQSQFYTDTTSFSTTAHRHLPLLRSSLETECLGDPMEKYSGLYHTLARYYSPSLHRFLSEDPATSNVNFFTYADNNPIVLADPNGLQSEGNGQLIDIGPLLGQLTQTLGELGVRNTLDQWAKPADWFDPSTWLGGASAAENQIFLVNLSTQHTRQEVFSSRAPSGT